MSNQADRKVFNHGEKQNEQLQSILWWCFHRSNKCSISALIGSRNHSVTSAAESALPTEWRVIGQDLASKSRENMASITREDFCRWFHQSHGDMSKKREEFPILSANFSSLCQRFCLYLLPHINYSIEAGSKRDKLILFTVMDQFLHLKIYVCK